MRRRNYQGNVVANGFFRAVAEQPFRTLIPTGDNSTQILAHDGIVRGIDDGSQQTGRMLGQTPSVSDTIFLRFSRFSHALATVQNRCICSESSVGEVLARE